MFFKPVNRLAKAVVEPGGKTIADAVSDAADSLAGLSDLCRAEIDAALADIHRLSATLPQGKDLHALYSRARDVAGLAGNCGLEDLGAATLSLCTLLDNAQNGGRLTLEHLAIHAGVFRLLRTPEAFTEADRARILADLETMIAKLSAKA
jgi:hypothetical protein